MERDVHTNFSEDISSERWFSGGLCCKTTEVQTFVSACKFLRLEFPGENTRSAAFQKSSSVHKDRLILGIFDTGLTPTAQQNTKGKMQCDLETYVNNYHENGTIKDTLTASPPGSPGCVLGSQYDCVHCRRR